MVQRILVQTRRQKTIDDVLAMKQTPSRRPWLDSPTQARSPVAGLGGEEIAALGTQL
jgi:hypothetical protein